MNKEKPKLVITTSEAMDMMFGDVSLEDITEEIVALFVSLGAAEGDIRYMQKEGWKFCPERNSFMAPFESEGGVILLDDTRK